MKVLAYKPVLLDLDGFSVRSYVDPTWVWRLDRILAASPCPMGHTTVDENCTCGIHVTLSTAFAQDFFDATEESPLDGALVPALSVVQVMGGLLLDDAGHGRADRIFMWGLLPPKWMLRDRRAVNTFVTKLHLRNDVYLDVVYDFSVLHGRVVDAWTNYKKEGKL